MQHALVALNPGKRVKHWRELKNVSQTELADRAAMDKSKVSRIESGDIKPRAEDIEVLAKAMGLSMPEFYGELERAS